MIGLPKPDGKNRLHKSNALNEDIVQAIEAALPAAAEQVKNIAEKFRGDSVLSTAKNIWTFLKKNIHYVKDGGNSQLVKMPSRFVADGTGDCKSYSLFTAAVLQALSLPASFRYASYSGSTIPSHIYTTTKDENGKEIIIDGVWPYFNSEKKPRYKFDHPMNVYTLTGTEDQDIGRSRRRRRRRGLSLLKKLAFAPNRRAFRTLVAVNLFGLAKKLKRMHDSHPGTLKKFWEKRLGGKYKELLKSIKAGYNHYAKRHHKARMAGFESAYSGEMQGIGIAPALAAVIAAAVPITTAIIPLLKKHGKDATEPGEPTLNETQYKSEEIKAENPPPQPEVMEGIYGRRRKRGRFAQRFKRLGLAPHRRAMRFLIATNFAGLAIKTARVAKNNPAALKSKWEKLGGRYPDLLKSISKGIARFKRRHKAGLMGPEGAAFSAAGKAGSGSKGGADYGALAATIIKALAGLFQKHGEPADGRFQPGESTFEKILAVADTAADKFGHTSVPADELIKEGKADEEAGKSDDPGGKGFRVSPLVWGGAALGTYLLLNKKR